MSTTQSDAERGTAQSAQCGPHSDGTRSGKPHAQARARARESSPGTAQSQPDSADPGKVTLSDYAAETGAWVRSTFTPPDVWSKDRPALSQVWAYASRGEWTTAEGAFRKAGQVYAITVAFPVVAAAYITAWVAERPGRLATVLILLVLLTQVPPLSWLI